MTSHALGSILPVTNCHTYSGLLPLERDVFYGRPRERQTDRESEGSGIAGACIEIPEALRRRGNEEKGGGGGRGGMSVYECILTPIVHPRVLGSTPALAAT